MSWASVKFYWLGYEHEIVFCYFVTVYYSVDSRELNDWILTVTPNERLLKIIPIFCFFCVFLLPWVNILGVL